MKLVSTLSIIIALAGACRTAPPPHPDLDPCSRVTPYQCMFVDEVISSCPETCQARVSEYDLVEKPRAPHKFKGYLLHEGSGKYAVALNAQASEGTEIVIFENHPLPLNLLVLTSDGYLYHSGSKKFIVAEVGPSFCKNGTKLVLSESFISNFDTFELTKGGLSAPSWLGVLRRLPQPIGDNDNPLVLWNFCCPDNNKLFNRFKFTP